MPLLQDPLFEHAVLVKGTLRVIAEGDEISAIKSKLRCLIMHQNALDLQFSLD